MKGLMKKAWSYLLVFALVFSMQGIVGFNTSVDKTSTVKADVSSTDCPQFDADKHVMVKEVTEPTSIAASSSQSFGISVPANETYWAQMHVKAEGDMYINLRDTKSRLYLGSSQCGIIVAEGFGTGKWLRRSTDLKNGVTVTVKSSATSVSLWIDGVLVVDNHTFNDVNTVGDFMIGWTTGTTTVNSLKVWTLSSEPKFSATEHKEVASLSNTTTAGSTSKNFGITIPADVSYWATYDVKTSGQIYFGVRGSEQSRMLVEGKQFGILGMFEKDIWTGHTLDTQAGYRVTIYSTPDKFSAWINGKKVADGLDVTKNKGLVGSPGLGWCTAETTITEAKVWVDKNAKLTDTPEYDAETDTLIKSIESKTIEKEKAFDFGFKVPANMDYYMTATIKASGGLYTSFRGDANRLYIDDRQYFIQGDGQNKWIQKKTNLAEGAKIAIKSTSESVSIWLNGEKIADNLALEDAKTEGAYVITWPTAETTITDVKIWVEGKSKVATVGTTKTVADANDKITLPTANAKYGWFSSDKMYKGGSEVVITDGMNFAAVNKLAVEFTYGAGIKLDNTNTGIRWQANVTSDCMDAVKSDAIKEGMLVTTNTEYTNNGAVVKDSITKINIENNGWYNNKPGTYCGSIVGIKEANWSRDFRARAYVTINYESGESVTVYSVDNAKEDMPDGMSVARSIKGIADKIIEQNGDTYTSNKELIDAFAAAR